MADLYIDDATATKLKSGEVVIKSWVYKNGKWAFRELTKKELNLWLKLAGSSKSL